MKVAVTAQGQDLSSLMDLRFGRAKWIHVVDTETGAHQVHDNTVHLNLPQGAGIQTGQKVANLGVEAIITGNVGPNAFRTLHAANIKIFLAVQQTVEQAVTAFKGGQLEEVGQANVEGHWA
jgi:predicted Fe-Mo cluster-binding NifX family protein